MEAYHKSAVSDDSPSYFKIAHIAIRNNSSKPTGRQVRPIESTRISKQSPFFFIENGIPKHISFEIKKKEQPSNRLVNHYKPKSIITKELNNKNKILRSDRDSVKSLIGQIQHIKNRSTQKAIKRSVDCTPNYSLYGNLAIPCSSRISQKSVSHTFMTHVPQQTRSSSRHGHYFEKSCDMIDDFEKKLKSVKESMPNLSTPEKYSTGTRLKSRES